MFSTDLNFEVEMVPQQNYDENLEIIIESNKSSFIIFRWRFFNLFKIVKWSYDQFKKYAWSSGKNKKILSINF